MKMAIPACLVSALFLFAVGCAKDRTAESWQNEKVSEKLSQISAISGSYSGNLVSEKNGTSLGSMTLQLSPDVRIQDNSDRTGTSLSPAVRATVTFNGDARASVSFQGGFYNSDTNYFKLITTIALDSGGTQKMEISGTTTGDTIEGEMAALDFPDHGGKFTLSRGATVDSTMATTFANRIEYFMHTRQVRMTDSHGNVQVETSKVKMSIDSSYTTAEETFLGMFSPLRRSLVTLTFWSGDSLGREIPISFNETVYDDRTDSLKGKTIFNDGGEKYTTSLECLREKRVEVNGWNCRIWNDARGTILTGFFEAVNE